MNRSINICLVLLLAACSFSRRELTSESSNVPALSEWIVTKPPAAFDSDHWSAAKHSDREWAVFLDQGRAAVKRFAREDDRDKLPFKMPEDLKGTARAAKVSDGWLVGFDQGEFGASLWWFSNDGEDSYKVSDDQVQCFIASEQGLLALQGLAHLSMSEGSVVRSIVGPDGNWRTETFVELNQAPDTGLLTPEGGSLLIVTSGQLITVGFDKKVETLVSNMFWYGLYPNSVVMDASGVVYIGMRHGVARIERRGASYHVDWLLPDRAAVEARPRY